MTTKQRVEQERTEVHDRLVKLCDFLNDDKFDELDDGMKSLLRMQFNAMAVYVEILDERLRIWKD